MTRDDLIRMAREAGAEEASPSNLFYFGGDGLERFAALVVAADREACARIVEAPHWKQAVRAVLKERAAEIRAKGTK